jgi:transcriptional regulator with XRE-family HTH domain
VRLPRKDVSPVWTRSFPISKEPQSVGEHLKKRRFGLGIRQMEAACHLRVSARTLSLWECDRVYPTCSQQPRIVSYLGYDPFTNPALGAPPGNETVNVASLAANSASLGSRIRARRLELRKTRKECAKELGVSVKTLWGWETDRWQPTALSHTRLTQFFAPRGIGTLAFGSHSFPQAL